jgi:hypothetical protein
MASAALDRGTATYPCSAAEAAAAYTGTTADVSAAATAATNRGGAAHAGAGPLREAR